MLALKHAVSDFTKTETMLLWVWKVGKISPTVYTLLLIYHYKLFCHLHIIIKRNLCCMTHLNKNTPFSAHQPSRALRGGLAEFNNTALWFSMILSISFDVRKTNGTPNGHIDKTYKFTWKDIRIQCI